KHWLVRPTESAPWGCGPGSPPTASSPESIHSTHRPRAPGGRSAGCTASRNRAPAPAPPPPCPLPEGDAGVVGRRPCLRWRLCSHPDLLSLLEELSFVLDRRCDHELGQLELLQCARPADAIAERRAPTRFWVPSSTRAGPS